MKTLYGIIQNDFENYGQLFDTEIVDDAGCSVELIADNWREVAFFWCDMGDSQAIFNIEYNKLQMMDADKFEKWFNTCCYYLTTPKEDELQ